MLFSSNVFLFGFLPCCLLLYFLTPRKLKNYTLLAFSLLFYAWGGPALLLVLLSVVAVDYVAAMAIGSKRLEGNKAGQRGALIAAVVLNLGTLIYYKYTGLFLETANTLLNLGINIPDIVLPIGVSFYIFQALSYVIDVYRKQVPPQKNPLLLLLYVSMFPQLVAGPIVRYKDIAEQIKERTITLEGVTYGMERFILGLFKKLVIADSMGALADTVYGTADPSTPIAWLGALAYMLQIYYDFSAYSDMAIGLGRIFGFRFLENFNYPYISQSITEFWRRWHMSLGNWFRDYVYIPLGGNRVSVSRHILNIVIVWALTGIWHGASWTFMLWGLYFAVFLMLEKYLLKNVLKKAPAGLCVFYTLVIVFFSWVLFRAESFDVLVSMLTALFSFSADSAAWGQASMYLQSYLPYFALGVVFAMPVYPKLRERVTAIESPQVRFAIRCVWYVALLAIFAVSMMFMAHSSYTPFIYFKF